MNEGIKAAQSSEKPLKSMAPEKDALTLHLQEKGIPYLISLSFQIVLQTEGLMVVCYIYSMKMGTGQKG